MARTRKSYYTTVYPPETHEVEPETGPSDQEPSTFVQEFGTVLYILHLNFP